MNALTDKLVVNSKELFTIYIDIARPPICEKNHFNSHRDMDPLLNKIVKAREQAISIKS